MGVETIAGAVLPGVISGIFSEDTPTPTITSASANETDLQRWLKNDIFQVANNNLKRIFNNDSLTANINYDTNKLKLKLDPEIANDYSGSNGAVNTMNNIANQFDSSIPTLTTNFGAYDADSIYNSAMATANQQANSARNLRLANLAEAGLGNSTLIGDVTADIDRELANTSYKAKNDAVNTAVNYNNQAIQLSNQAKTNQSDLLTNALKNKLGTIMSTQGLKTNLRGETTQNQMYNTQADYNEYIRQQNDLDNSMANIISLINGQAGIQSTAMNNANAINLANYQNQVQATRDQNQTIANVASQLFKPTGGWGSGK